jgi:uncharacterized protein YebE (UPF0316 family)
MELINTELYRWLILPLAIFAARVVTETIGTLRIMFLARGNRVAAPLLGFFEVLLWIIVIGEIMQNLNNPMCYVAYAAGFAVGSYVGMMIETHLALGIVLVNVITRKNTDKLQESLRDNSYGFTKLDGQDIDGVENIFFIIVKRKELDNVIKIIKEFNPCAFFSIEDVRGLNEGKYPLKCTKKERHYIPHFIRRRFTRHG